jgi:hypothetical protein
LLRDPNIALGSSNVPDAPSISHAERIFAKWALYLSQTAVSLRRATDIRAYVDAVKTIVAKETASMSSEKIERRWKWALAEADLVDPVRSARFLRGF